MRLNTLRSFAAAGLLAAPFLAAAQAPAQPQRGAIELSHIAEVDVETKGADGKVTRKRAPALKAVPGTVGHYTSSFSNISDKPAEGIAITNPIPANTTLVAGSPWGQGMDIHYSADGAKTWATVDKIRIKGADGKERPAGLKDITHVRWSLRGELAPGKQGSCGFDVTIN